MSEPKALDCSACKKRIEPDEDYILLKRVVMTETSLSIGNRYYHVRHDATPRRRVAENPERWHMVFEKAGEPSP